MIIIMQPQMTTWYSFAARYNIKCDSKVTTSNARRKKNKSVFNAHKKKWAKKKTKPFDGTCCAPDKNSIFIFLFERTQKHV